MRSYPRRTNRFILFLIGIILWALAALLVCLRFLPQIRSKWENAFNWLAQVEELWTPISSSSPAGLILLIMMGLVLFISFIFINLLVMQGGGRCNRVMKVAHNDAQAMSIAQVSFIEDLLKQKLVDPHLVHSVSASAWKVRKETVVRIDMTLKHGVNPADIRLILDTTIADMDSLFGTTIPILVHLSRPWLERKAARTS